MDHEFDPVERTVNPLVADPDDVVVRLRPVERATRFLARMHFGDDVRVIPTDSKDCCADKIPFYSGFLSRAIEYDNRHLVARVSVRQPNVTNQSSFNRSSNTATTQSQSNEAGSGDKSEPTHWKSRCRTRKSISQLAFVELRALPAFHTKLMRR